MADGAIKVLHVVPDLSPGGAPLGACELVQRLSRVTGVDARLCVIGHRSEGERSGLDGVRYLDVANPQADMTALGRSVARLRRVIRAEGPAIVHSHLLPADLVAALAVVGPAGPVHVSHVRDTRAWLASPRLQSVIKRTIYSSAFRLAGTRFLAVSNDAAAYAVQHLGIAAARMTVVLNGIDTAPFQSIARKVGGDGRPTVIGTAGRLVAEKGHDILIEAVGLLHRRGLAVRLEIAGTGSRQDALRALARENGIDEHVTMRGQVGDMPAFYRGLDVFVLPSVSSEGLSRALLEAMACGTAVVATRTEGVGDVVTDGVSGLIVPKGDVSAMAEAIGELVMNAETAKRLGEAGRARVLGHFTVDRVAADVVQIYRQMLVTAGTVPAPQARAA